MRKVLFGAAAVLAIAAPAGIAHAGTQGSIDLSYATSDFDDDNEFSNIRLGGTIVHGLGGNMTVQADAATSLQSWDGDDDDYSHAHAAAHLSWDLGQFDVGGFGGILNYYGDGGTVFGAEGRTAFGNFSIDGSASLVDFNDWMDGSSLRLGGAFFVTPNFEINAGISRTDLDNGDDWEITDFSLGAAYQFANNIELYGDYTNSEEEADYGYEEEGDTFRIGLRFNIGGGTLQDNQNNGAFGSVGALSDTLTRW